MALELVLLSETAPGPELVQPIAARLLPGGASLSHRGGRIVQFLDASGRSVLTLFAAKPVERPQDAAAALAEPPASFGLWTEMIIPFGDPEPGRSLAEAIARSVDGVVRERI